VTTCSQSAWPYHLTGVQPNKNTKIRCQGTTTPAKTSQAPPHSPARRICAHSLCYSRLQSSSCCLQTPKLATYSLKKPGEVYEVDKRRHIGTTGSTTFFCRATEHTRAGSCDVTLRGADGSPRATLSLKKLGTGRRCNGAQLVLCSCAMLRLFRRLVAHTAPARHLRRLKDEVADFADRSSS
jgi:hypothetical protein